MLIQFSFFLEWKRSIYRAIFQHLIFFNFAMNRNCLGFLCVLFYLMGFLCDCKCVFGFPVLCSNNVLLGFLCFLVKWKSCGSCLRIWLSFLSIVMHLVYLTSKSLARSFLLGFLCYLWNLFLFWPLCGLKITVCRPFNYC